MRSRSQFIRQKWRLIQERQTNRNRVVARPEDRRASRVPEWLASGRPVRDHPSAKVATTCRREDQPSKPPTRAPVRPSERQPDYRKADVRAVQRYRPLGSLQRLSLAGLPLRIFYASEQAIGPIPAVDAGDDVGSDGEEREGSVDECPNRVLRCADYRLLMHIEARVDQARNPGEPVILSEYRWKPGFDSSLTG